MVTLVCGAPNPGENPVIVGCTTKLLLVKSDPAGVMTRMRPVVAATGTTASIARLLRTLKFVESRLLNRTALAPIKLVPVTITLVPVRPAAGAYTVLARISLTHTGL